MKKWQVYLASVILLVFIGGIPILIISNIFFKNDIYEGLSQEQKLKKYEEIKLRVVKSYICSIFHGQIIDFEKDFEANEINLNTRYFPNYDFHFWIVQYTAKHSIKSFLQLEYDIPFENSRIDNMPVIPQEELNCPKTILKWAQLKTIYGGMLDRATNSNGK